MAVQLAALSLAARDPLDLARFWAGVLSRPVVDEPSGSVVLRPPPDAAGFGIRFAHSDAAKVEPNRMHFDLTSSSLENQRQVVARALELGGRHLDVGQLPEEPHVVLADPEGNEFCVIEPGNDFLADCGLIGALACDGSQEVGCFWRDALGWPLVWDQEQETAIQSPAGGTKITWGGPPVAPKVGKGRLHFDLTVRSGSDQLAEVDRLAALGAERPSSTPGPADGVEMTDPDGNEFRVLPSPAPAGQPPPTGGERDSSQPRI